MVPWIIRMVFGSLEWAFLLAAALASMFAWDAFSSGAVWVGLPASLFCMILWALSRFFESQRKKPDHAW